MFGQNALNKLNVPFSGNPRDFTEWMSRVGYDNDITVADYPYEFKYNDPTKPFRVWYYNNSWKSRKCNAFVVLDVDNIPQKVKRAIKRSGRKLLSISEFPTHAQYVYRRHLHGDKHRTVSLLENLLGIGRLVFGTERLSIHGMDHIDESEDDKHIEIY